MLITSMHHFCDKNHRFILIVFALQKRATLLVAYVRSATSANTRTKDPNLLLSFREVDFVEIIHQPIC